jgi:hypothetical protein
MPIIVAVLGTLLLWVAFWFIRFGGLQVLQARAAQRKEEARRATTRETARLAPLRAIDDPRDAAAILMVLIARQNGDPTREQIGFIEERLRTVFGFERELTERMTHARFIAAQAESFAQAAHVFATLFRQRLTEAERSELLDMIEDVARHEGPSAQQIDAISAFKPMIGVAAGA